MRIFKMLALLAAVALLSFAGPVAAETAEGKDQALTDLVQILKNEGVLDEGQYNQLTAKAAKAEAKESWTDRLSLWGDFRGRWEGFYYTDEDSDVRTRSRFRYRFRLNGKARVNPYATVLFRIASGGDDNRSTNQTLGSGVDFDSDPIRIDRAYVQLSPFKEGRYPDENGTLYVDAGKVPNPYIRKWGKDYMLWDSDINFEGASLTTEREIFDDVGLYFNTGYYVIDENSGAPDPNLFALQIGTEAGIGAHWDVGARVSYFRYGSVDAAMLMRGEDGTGGVTSASGNIFDGMTTSDSVNIIESRAYAKFGYFEEWPILVFASVSSNLSAVRSATTGVGPESIAWGVGAEVGDKKNWLLVGAGYYDLQANSQFSQFVDSDLFDGNTNRKGFAVYGAKQILENTEVVLTTFWGKPSNDNPAFGDTLAKASRVRIQADMSFKF